MNLKGTGVLAKKMLGFADDFISGATKGTDAQVIKASVNKVKSNMTSNQKQVLKNVKFKQMQETQKIAQATKQYYKTNNGISGTINTKNAKKINKVDNVKIGNDNTSFAGKAGDFFGAGTRETIKGIKSGKSFKESSKNAFMDGEKLRMDRVAGTFMAASAAGRIASGGGIYKDRNGSTNLIGVPFI